MELFILLVLSQARTIGEHITQVTFILLYNRLIKQAYKTFKNIAELLQMNKKGLTKIWEREKKIWKDVGDSTIDVQEVTLLKSLTPSIQ